MQNTLQTTLATWLESLSHNVKNVAMRIVGVTTPNAALLGVQVDAPAVKAAPRIAPPEKFKLLLGDGVAIKNRRQLHAIEYLATHGYATRAQLDTLLGVKHSPKIIRTLRRQCFWDIWSVWGKTARLFKPDATHVYFMPPTTRKIAVELLKWHECEQKDAEVVV